MNSGVDKRLTSIPEVLELSERKNNFNERIMEMKMNRSKMMEERNLIDLEKIKKNSEQQLGDYRIANNIENAKDNLNNNLEVQTISYDNVNELSNIGVSTKKLVMLLTHSGP